MTVAEYTAEALKTKKYKNNIWLERVTIEDDGKMFTPMHWVYPALKLAGEAGEVTEKLGKIVRDKQGVISAEDRIELLKELGDVLWYVNALAADFDSTLEEVMQMNIDKLASRQARGVLSGSGDNR